LPLQDTTAKNDILLLAFNTLELNGGG